MEQLPKYDGPVLELAQAQTAEHDESCDRFLQLLREFYSDLAEPPSIDVEFVATRTIPLPQRSLLVHTSDMTSTLAGHYGESIRLRVLDCHEGPKWYRRHIVLETAATCRAVEYGAIRIHLPLLSEAARRDVLDAKSPLGSVLVRHRLDYRHCPGGYFRIHTNRLMEQALRLSWPRWLYGRCNCMSDGVGRTVAEVIEILPP